MENHHAGLARNRPQSGGCAGRCIDIVPVQAEKVVEQAAPRRGVQRLVLSWTVDVLEQGEAVDPHLQTMGADEFFEPPHEQGQDLVDVHDDERRGRIDAQLEQLRRQRVAQRFFPFKRGLRFLLCLVALAGAG